MKFTFNKLGYVDQGNIELGEMTLICGPNNVGKTWLSYGIYGLLKHYSSLVSFDLDDQLIPTLVKKGSIKIDLRHYVDQLDKLLKQLSKNFSRTLSNYFNTDSTLLAEAKIGIEIASYTLDITQELKRVIRFGRTATLTLASPSESPELDIILQDDDSGVPAHILSDIINQELAQCLLASCFERPFVLTSERTGISLFYKELDLSKNILVEHLASDKGINPFKLLNSMRSRYAEPIKDNIDIVRDADAIAKEKSFLKKDKNGAYKPIFDTLKEITGGNFKITNDQVLYQPVKERNRKKTTLPIYLASSSIKSLFLLDLYINCLAEKNSVLIIDEPELNLHPDKQRQMAKLLARMVNAGVKVVMTTHSDFLIREINNRIMLNSEFDQRDTIMKRHKLVKEDILRPDQVKAYTVHDDHRIHALEVADDGIDTKIFDQRIEEANTLQDEIYYQSC